MKVVAWLLILLVTSSLGASHLVTGRAFAGALLSGGIHVVPDEYGLIQAAIDDVPEGSTILVRSGEYSGPVNINKRLSIIGSGDSTVIKSVGGWASVEIPRGINGVVFEGFCVDGSGGASIGINVRSQGNVLINNTVINHKDIGICIYDSSDNFLRGNQMMNNTRNLKVWGLSLEHFLHDIDSSNLVDGRPVCYWVNKANQSVPLDVGYVAVVNSTAITVAGFNLTSNYSGVLLAYTNDSSILNLDCRMNAEGIRLVLSNNNTIANNNVMANDWIGISFVASSNNSITRNNVAFNDNGMYFSYSSLLPPRSDYNNVCQNSFSQNRNGFYLDNSSFNSVCENAFTANSVAAYFDISNHNVFSRNQVLDSVQCGFKIDKSESNTFYHNNFANNTVHVSVVDYSPNPPSTNIWDNGYPDGGNYWSDYRVDDLYWSAFQNATGADGIGDAPYFIRAGNHDDFPLMGFFDTLDAGTWDGTSFDVYVISNGTIMNFEFAAQPVKPFVRFDLVNESGEKVFCRVIIPKSLLSADGDWVVVTDAGILSYASVSNLDSAYIYFTCTGGNVTVSIEGTHALSESLYFAIGPLAMIFATVSLVLMRKRRRVTGRDAK
ncbi:right-handed parallel beta-helix repeat-containing protein [Candidatus Bathyarchaeota archaeon]|nr:right-handed parallel beta-helix repeat-containing protein [Candidatus Bathyarchaeota archaeon]